MTTSSSNGLSRSPSPSEPAREAASSPKPRLLITAGPTHEPIDSVRFIGNRSSGRMGAALANAAATRGWDTTLLLGPAPFTPDHPGVRLIRFRTCEDLRALLSEHTPDADIVVMAAAVADYRPKPDPRYFNGKFRRTSEKLVLELEPTPDLIAEVANRRSQSSRSQLLVGFALEPREEMLDAAQRKLVRKKIDMVVANPLETMDSSAIEATLVFADRPPLPLDKGTKAHVADLVIDHVAHAWHARAQATNSGAR